MKPIFYTLCISIAILLNPLAKAQNCADPANVYSFTIAGSNYEIIKENLSIEGNWIWDGDNDGIGEQFWEGNYNGNPVNGLYNNWGGEPDNWNTQNGLGLALTSWPYGDAGQWNDVDDSNDLYYIVEYENPIGIKNHENELNLLVYPNPATEKVFLKLNNDKSITQVNIYNQMGVSVINTKFLKDFNGSIDVSNFVPGPYFINIAIESGDIFSKLIIIE